VLGVRLAVDDYGTGYASLAYLSTLPVHDLKLDKSFVIAMGGDGQDAERARSIVASTVTLSNALGLDLIAEGVETAEILTQLRELGCTAAPGLPHKPAVDVHRAHCLARSPRTGTRRSQLMHRANSHVVSTWGRDCQPVFEGPPYADVASSTAARASASAGDAVTRPMRLVANFDVEHCTFRLGRLRRHR